MPKVQKNFIKGRMNKSVDERLVPQGEYIDALNVRLGSTEGTEIGAVENSKGNELLVQLTFLDQALSSEAKCIGAYEDGQTKLFTGLFMIKTTQTHQLVKLIY